MEKYSVYLRGLSFSAAHFITFGRSRCEQLHGHNFRVEVEWTGPLGKHGYVVDFRQLKGAMVEILAELQDRVLLPLQNPHVQVVVDRGVIQVQCGKNSWEFPRQGCALLEVENVTAEGLAAYLARRLKEAMTRRVRVWPESLCVCVEEEPGCWACFRETPDTSEARSEGSL
jgi:6-pyruvoyltetrahydropterin/6-carboxytetrahydropterin synthase